MNKRLAAVAILVAAVAAAALGLFASPSHSASGVCPTPPPLHSGCLVSLTATGPSPSTMRMPAGNVLFFANPDSVSHTVVFANGRCSLTLAPGEGVGEFGNRVSCDEGTPDWTSFAFYAGSYAYTVDGKFSGTVVTTPWSRSVTLTARTHTIRAGARVTLHGRIVVNNPGISPPVPVVVLARHTGEQHFEPVARVRTNYYAADTGNDRVAYGWNLNVQPGVTTTYIAEVTGQRLCYFPASRCAHPQGQFWVNAKSRPVTVRVRH